jgi:hypothetical protein
MILPALGSCFREFTEVVLQLLDIRNASSCSFLALRLSRATSRAENRRPLRLYSSVTRRLLMACLGALHRFFIAIVGCYVAHGASRGSFDHLHSSRRPPSDAYRLLQQCLAPACHERNRSFGRASGLFEQIVTFVCGSRAVCDIGTFGSSASRLGGAGLYTRRSSFSSPRRTIYLPDAFTQ